MEGARSTRTWRLASAAILALALAAFASAAHGAVKIEGLHERLPDLDVRTAGIEPSAAQTAAAARLGASVTWNRAGTPSSVYDLDGTLAKGLQAPSAVAAARAWLGQQQPLFGLANATDLALVRDTPLAEGGGHAVLLGQLFDGVLAAPDGLVTVAVAGSAADGWDVTYASSTLARDASVTGDDALSPEQAWVEAANAVGSNVSSTEVQVTGRKAGWTELKVDGFQDKQAVRKSAFPAPGKQARAAFQTLVTDGDDVGYAQTVDASTGEILSRTDTVDNAVDNPAWKAFPAFPLTSTLNAFPWNYASTDTQQLWCWTLAAGCDLAVGNTANAADVSMPWDQTDPAGPPTFTTRGNNANSREQWITASMDPPRAAGTLFQPTSATRDYVYPWTNVWFTSSCDPSNLVDAAGAPRAGTGNDISAAVANLFAMHNRMHDWSYELGFTEAAWNGQQNNFGTPLPFLGNDPVTGNAQAGGITGGFPSFNGRDNANMNTQRDGTPSVTNMFLWQPIAGSFYAPCVDGDYDMTVIAHEFGHMIENRMIGKGFRRMGQHAGAMGEAFGDLNAAEYVTANHFVPVSGLNPFVTGAYVTGNPFRGIRDYAMNWPMSGPFPTPGVNPAVNALNLGDYAFDLTGQEVHADGEIWVATNYTLRQLLLNRYPSPGASVDVQCANGLLPLAQCPGDRRWMQLYFDAMLLMPTGPTLVDARNAILAADATRFGGANQDLLWRGFAERGFGQFALAAANNDNDPIADFSSPQQTNATVTFRAITQDVPGRETLVPARVYVGDYEARVTQIADTDPANDPASGTTNLDASASFVPTAALAGDGTGAGYNFVAVSPGSGHVRFRIQDLVAGENRTVTIVFPHNVASSASGATASGDGTDQANLIDETEGTQWVSTGTTDVAGRQVLIALHGRQTFRIVKASALLGPMQNRFTALRSFEVLACDQTLGKACNPATAGDWTSVLVSQPDAFPSVNPRPVAPDLIMRAWKIPRVTATHVLFRVRTNQCSGQASYQGEQDSDPQFSTDCRLTSLNSMGDVALPRRDTDVRAAELELLSAPPRVQGAVVEDLPGPDD
jgi:extracellular elastinolytic metalloproteinase